MAGLFMKPGVDLSGLALGGCRILEVVAAAPARLGHAVTITCGREAHAPTDHHTLGEALDLRTHDLTPEQVLALYKYMAAELGAQFTVLYEVPIGQRAGLDPLVADLVYAPSNPNAQHLHAQVKNGVTYVPV